MKDESGLDTNQYVVFRLLEEEYGISIQWINTIEKIVKITRMPKAPKSIRGVINLRGEIIPVMSLRERFNLEIDEDTDETRVIIVKVGEYQVGIVVDIVEEVIQLSDELTENASNLSIDISMDFILRVGKTDGRVISLLNMEKLVNI